MRRVARSIGQQPWQLALQGGEDYELCFTARPGAAEQLASAVGEKTGTVVTTIGTILPEANGRWLVLEDGSEIPLEARGWEHFKGLA
jgi:thiamine-monophosphate kinase